MLFALGHHHISQYITSKIELGNDTWQGKIMENMGILIRQIQNKYFYEKLI